MKKPVLILLLVFAALFGAVTVLKSRPGGEAAPAEADTLSGERTELRRFWAVYREATDHRLAGRYRAAADAYGEALALDDRHEDALYYLGNVRWTLEESEAARAAWERLAAVNPNSARAQTRLGDLHFCPAQPALFDLDAAGAAYASAHAINREETGPLLHLGQIALVRGALGEARSYFAAVLGSHERSVAAAYLDGYVAWAQGASVLARTRLTEAVQYTRPEAPTGGVAGEGDTRKGAAPLTVEAATCATFEPFLAALENQRGEPSPSDVNRSYEALDAFVQQLRTMSPGF